MKKIICDALDGKKEQKQTCSTSVILHLSLIWELTDRDDPSSSHTPRLCLTNTSTYICSRYTDGDTQTRTRWAEDLCLINQSWERTPELTDRINHSWFHRGPWVWTKSSNVEVIYVSFCNNNTITDWSNISKHLQEDFYANFCVLGESTKTETGIIYKL